jgi:TonB family protein
MPGNKRVQCIRGSWPFGSCFHLDALAALLILHLLGNNLWENFLMRLRNLYFLIGCTLLLACASSNPLIESQQPDSSRPQMSYYAEPQYPMIAWAAGLEGTVTLEVTITERGQVENPQTVVTSGYGALDDAALRAAPLCKWKPAIVVGRPVTAMAQYQVAFRLPASPPGN